MTEYHAVARDDGVHVLSEMCLTCVFRPHNVMLLEPGRLKGMIAQALRDGSCIPCHSTIRRDDGVQPAICRGFFDRYGSRVVALRLADHLDMLVFENPPGEER